MLRRVPIAAVMALLSLLLSGYQFAGADNDLWIPFIVKAANPALYPGDPAVASPQGLLSFHVDLLAALSSVVDLEWLLFVLFAAFRVLAFVALGELFLALTDDETASAVGLALLAAPHPVAGTMAFSFSQHFLPRTFVEVLGPLALLAVVRSRHAVAGGLLGVSFLLHPISALPVAAAAAARVLVVRGGKRAMLLLAVGCAAGAVPVLVRARTAALEAPAITMPDADWVHLLRWQVPYAFLAEWDVSAWRSCALWASWIALAAARRALSRDVAAFAGGATALAAVAFVLGEQLGLVEVLPLQCARALAIPLVLSAACAGAWATAALRVGGERPVWTEALAWAPAGALVAAWALRQEGLACAVTLVAALVTARHARGRHRALALGVALLLGACLGATWSGSSGELSPWRPEPWLALACGAAAALARVVPFARRGLALRAGCVVAVALVVRLAGAAPIAAPWMPHAGWGAELAHWAREQTPEDASFCVPPGARSFRALAQRTSMFEPADAGAIFFSRAYAAEWLRRWRRFGDESSLQARVAELRAGAFDYLVVPRTESRLGLPVAYEDAWFRVHARPEAGRDGL